MIILVEDLKQKMLFYQIILILHSIMEQVGYMDHVQNIPLLNCQGKSMGSKCSKLMMIILLIMIYKEIRLINKYKNNSISMKK